MSRNVDFVFTKGFGGKVKGDVVNYDRAFASQLQDVRKVGKIQKPTQDKTDKTVGYRNKK